MVLLRILYWLLCGLSILASLLPIIPSRHWWVRIFEYGRVQNFLLLAGLLTVYPFVNHGAPGTYIVLSLLFLSLLYNGWLLLPYTGLFHSPAPVPKDRQDRIRLLTANVYQFNKEPKRFIELVRKYDPDIILTMESNGAWDQALAALEKDYPYAHKIPLENTYGMHLYTRLPVEELKTQHLVAQDIPSIRARLLDQEGRLFTLYGVHPPPPSPTEEPTSLERDAELLAVAKEIRKRKESTLVAGDFNNVAWSRSSKLFKKMSQLIDPRVGRGLIPTFHTRYRLIRVPIDQLYHSSDVFVTRLSRGEDFGSDHYPLICEFFVHPDDNRQTHRVEDVDSTEKQEALQRIKEGKAEDSDRPAIAKP